MEQTRLQTVIVIAEAGSGWLATVLWSGAVAIVVVVVMTVLQNRATKAAQRAGWTSPQHLPKGRGADEARAGALMNDMEELSQRLAADLDKRAGRLEELVAHADERIARLERLAAATSGGRMHSGPAPMIETKRPAGGGGAGARPHPLDPVIDVDPITTQIYRLADEGLPPVEIARRLSQHTGKVELIIALRQR